MSPDEARLLYERITTEPEFDAALQLHPDTKDRDALITRVGDALRDCRIEGRLTEAPSPWHAFFMLWKQHADARVKDVAVFFRGHNRIGLSEITAGLHRSGLSPEAKRRALLTVDILAYMIECKEIISYGGGDPRILARSIAQHYGIPTTYLDVTLDPAVAVFFASMDGGTETAAAFTFAWELCDILEVPIVVPPISPWSQRLSVQRGFFLDCAATPSLSVELVPFEVRFPKMPGFEVRRSGTRYVPWPICEPRVEQLMHWVDSVTAVHHYVDADIKAVIAKREVTRSLLHHQFFDMFGFEATDPPPGPGPHAPAQQALTKHYLDALSHLECFVNLLCLQKSGVSLSRLQHLRASNRVLFDQYEQQIRSLVAAGRSDFAPTLKLMEQSSAGAAPD